MTDRIVARRLVVLAAGVMAACAAPAEPELRIVGSDYAFTAPDSVPAGAAVLRFTNTGKVRHELQLVEVRDDVSTAEFTDSISRGTSARKLRATGSAVLFANPGAANDEVGLRVTFVRGRRYALVCQFRDSATAPRHQTLGMFKIVGVR